MKKWRVLEEVDISPSKWFPLRKQKVQLPNGTLLDDYYVARLGNVAMTIPLTTNGEIVFVRQYKNGIAEFTLELPAGFIEKHQSPLDAAQAELQQETGIISSGLDFLGELWTMPTKADTRVFGFLARNCVIAIDQNLDSSEEIEVVKIPIAELNALIASGKINCSDTMALLLLAKIKRAELFSR